VPDWPSTPLLIPSLIDGLVFARSIYRGIHSPAHKLMGAANLAIHRAGTAICLQNGSTKAALGKT
jgi:hypothetical protein